MEYLLWFDLSNAKLLNINGLSEHNSEYSATLTSQYPIIIFFVCVVFLFTSGIDYKGTLLYHLPSLNSIFSAVFDHVFIIILITVLTYL